MQKMPMFHKNFFYLFYGTHHWMIFRSSYRKLDWVRFHLTTTEFCSLVLTNSVIRLWVQLALRTNFVQLLQFHHFFSVHTFFRPLSSFVATFISIEVWQMIYKPEVFKVFKPEVFGLFLASKLNLLTYSTKLVIHNQTCTWERMHELDTWNHVKKDIFQYVIRCMIWYHLYNLKIVTNTHRGL